MYNLYQFFVRYHLLIIFISLQAASYYLVYRYSNYHKAEYTNVANSVSGKMYSTYNGITGYLHLQQVNDSLVAENALLRSRLEESKYDLSANVQTVTDTAKRFTQQYTYITARAISNSTNKPVNLIYLNKGRMHGLEKQMGVISPAGVVGQVIDVTEHYAVAMSVLSESFKVSARIKKNNYFGNLSWTGTSDREALLEEIPKHVRLEVGDTIVTSGYSHLFPRNVMVGTVKSVEAKPEKAFLDITLQLSTDFGRLDYVYVVKNLMKPEVLQLDSTAQKLIP